MRALNPVLAACAIVLLTASCRPVALPPEVVVVSGAFDIRPQKQSDGAIGVDYRINEPFPADGVLGCIRAALAARAWDPMPMDWMNPDIESSHRRGWHRWSDAFDTESVVTDPQLRGDHGQARVCRPQSEAAHKG